MKTTAFLTILILGFASMEEIQRELDRMKTIAKRYNYVVGCLLSAQNRGYRMESFYETCRELAIEGNPYED